MCRTDPARPPASFRARGRGGCPTSAVRRDIPTTAIAGGLRSSPNSRQATAVRAAAKRESTGREPWLTPFRDFAAPQLVAVVGGEVVEPTANAVGFREIARPALVDRFCFVAKQTPSETHAKRREARYFYNRRCKPPDSRPPPQIRGKPRQCAPPRNARAQAARLWLLGNSGRWAR